MNVIKKTRTPHREQPVASNAPVASNPYDSVVHRQIRTTHENGCPILRASAKHGIVSVPLTMQFALFSGTGSHRQSQAVTGRRQTRSGKLL
jgi:hypothetical protein